MHIQLARFFAVDPYVTFFTAAAVYMMTRAVGVGKTSNVKRKADRPPTNLQTRLDHRLSLANLFLASAFVGLAVGSKFAAVMLFLPLTTTIWTRQFAARKRANLFITAVFIAILSFFVTNPFAILDLSCEVITPAVEIGPVMIPSLDWRSCYLDNIATQSAMARGDIDLPFTRQYSGTLPYLYFIEMQLKWGMGPLLGLAAFVGLGWAVWQALKRWREGFNCELSIVNCELLIVLTWVVPYFLTTGAFYVKFMRYLQPITPFLMVFAAAMIVSWGKRWRSASKWALAVILITTAFYAIGFVNMYRQPHPWVTASQWIYANVEPGTLILSEQWDDSLPSSMWVNGVYRRRAEYPNAELTWHTGIGEKDSAEKLAANLDLLAEAEYLTLVSNRVYGVVPRLPEKYPLSSQYHQLLFDGSLGYEVVTVYGRSPQLFGLHLQPDTFSWPGQEPSSPVTDYLATMPGVVWGRADESFLAYDQPLVMIFENVEGLTAEELRRRFP
ncbi:MAG: hypothetical protein GY803_06500 [Chloroflexi bacterium]|nr:hypothetical protein [Chloroflexota bacterium]